jgi:predicted nucleic acid-binding protein
MSISVKQRLRIQAAAHNRSMEEEARLILQRAVERTEAAGEMGSRIHRRFKEAGGVEMPDAQIAAICRAEKCTLATRNTKNFEGTEIDLINPFDQ